MVVFEPHTFSWRNRDALAWYDTVFEGAARVLLLPPPSHGAQGHDQLGRRRDRGARSAPPASTSTPSRPARTAIGDLAASLAGDEVVLLLSSGPLDGLPASLPPVLDAAFG